MRFLLPLLFVFTLACASDKPASDKRPGGPGPRQERVDEACMRACMQRNAARAVGAEQIEYDCRLDCAR